ncbi:MAG: peptide chain release factor-like protein [Planctomycetota bacterium]
MTGDDVPRRGATVHPARLPAEELLREVRIETARGSGPGGQHRNKTETAVRAIHLPTGIEAHASERRSLHINKSQAVKRLRLKLAIEHRCPLPEDSFIPPGIFEPSPLWRSRLRERRIVASVDHVDFPALLSEALDVLEHCGDDVSRAAGLLLTSTAQLVKFLDKEPLVLSRLNERRRKHGLKPFHTT